MVASSALRYKKIKPDTLALNLELSIFRMFCVAQTSKFWFSHQFQPTDCPLGKKSEK